MSLNRRAFLKSTGSGALALGLSPVLVALPEAAGPRRGAVLRLADEPQFSGIYPHLAFFNDENECGVGAVVPWAGRLWVVTYAPHKPLGSSDKLYEIDEALSLTVRPESVGGTPANRMIHAESGQLFIGPYAIGQDRQVRVIPPDRMPGRLTGTARHLTEPAGKVYFATMEEGFYEVDVCTLEVTRVINPDGNALNPARCGRRTPARLPRQGLLHRPGPPRLRQQRRVQPRGPPTSGHSLRRARPVGRGDMGGGAAEPVHRGDRAGRHRGQRARGGPGLELRVGPPLGPSHAPRWRHVAVFPDAEGEPHLRRRARLAHRMAAHPRHRRGGRRPDADDDARHVLGTSRKRSPPGRRAASARFRATSRLSATSAAGRGRSSSAATTQRLPSLPNPRFPRQGPWLGSRTRTSGSSSRMRSINSALPSVAVVRGSMTTSQRAQPPILSSSAASITAWRT